MSDQFSAWQLILSGDAALFAVEAVLGFEADVGRHAAHRSVDLSS